jgi:hypothetical protein
MELLKRVLDAMHGARKGARPLTDGGRWQPKWTIEKYHSGDATPYAVETIDGNLLLTEGITELLKLLTGAAGTTAFNNANARLGVGDSTTAAANSQTDLQAATNKTYKAMDTGYPTVANNVVTFKSTFAETEANYAWQEYVVDNGATAGKTLNRKVEAHGTKASGDIWVLTLTVTIS